MPRQITKTIRQYHEKNIRVGRREYFLNKMHSLPKLRRDNEISKMSINEKKKYTYQTGLRNFYLKKIDRLEKLLRYS